jgi:hypothetical protein
MNQGINTVQVISEIMRHVHQGFSLAKHPQWKDGFCRAPAFSRQNVPKASTTPPQKLRTASSFCRTFHQNKGTGGSVLPCRLHAYYAPFEHHAPIKLNP